MKKRNIAYASLFLFGTLMTSCGTSNKTVGVPELTGMKCEFVADGGEAVIYGKNLTNAKVVFPGNLEANVITDKSNDSVLTVTVPSGTSVGKINVKTAQGEVQSNFFFRDDRNTIINFDDRLATWGGYEPFDENGDKITGTLEHGSDMTPLPAELPEPCSGNYGFLYGKYNNPWSMTQTMYIQYVANPDEGGRGPISVASKAFEAYNLSDLALKFEIFIPKEVGYNGVKTEIFFGPYNSPDKHGREISPICFWEPYSQKGNFCTDGWQTITIPLTEFYHGTKSDEEISENKLDLKNATNFSFVQFGNPNPQNAPQIFMCIDNFRIVPVVD